jgi:hypothetical protein
MKRREIECRTCATGILFNEKDDELTHKITFKIIKDKLFFRVFYRNNINIKQYERAGRMEEETINCNSCRPIPLMIAGEDK